jgi:homoserine kinase
VIPIRVRAPATTANLGPGFDCAAVALDLWNELEVSDGGGPVDEEYLGVRAFSLLAPVEGRRFAFTDRIPRARGLGSSAAVIALGLAAGALAAKRDLDPEALLEAGAPLEGHPDNLAAALAGGVCLTWGGRIARIADRAPAVPVAVIPENTVETAAARGSLPLEISHADATLTAGRAALLGAGLASGSAELFAAALDDRLHEPYRAAQAPILADVRGQLPESALGATLSGSGPTVIVWATDDAADACVQELAERFPEAQVQRLAVATRGAGPA